MKIDDVLTLIGFSATFLVFFTESIMPEVGILFVLIAAISIFSVVVIHSRRTLRELKSFMKGDDKNQDN